jgi:hypothetical protein
MEIKRWQGPWIGRFDRHCGDPDAPAAFGMNAGSDRHRPRQAAIGQACSGMSQGSTGNQQMATVQRSIVFRFS